MDTEITIETVSVSKFWSHTSEALSFRHIVCFCVQMCIGVYVDVVPVTLASVHLFFKWYFCQVLCCELADFPVPGFSKEDGQAVTVQWAKQNTVRSPRRGQERLLGGSDVHAEISRRSRVSQAVRGGGKGEGPAGRGRE